MTLFEVLALLGGAVPGYLIGAVPFGLILGRTLRGVDIREHGSGNIGATNALRVLGKPIGVTALFLDFGKGLAAALLGPRVVGSVLSIDPRSEDRMAWAMLAAGLSAVLGHVFPVYLGFRGGKGVATGAGVLVALAPVPTAAAAAGFGIVVALTRFVSLGSVTAAVVLPAVVLLLGGARAFGAELPRTIAACAIGGLVLVRHRSNLRRLLDGTEPRLGGKRERAA